MTGPARFTISEVGSWLARANGAAAQTVAIQLHALTYNWTRGMQLANTPPLQSTTPGLHPVSIHQMSPLVRKSKHLITAYYSLIRLTTQTDSSTNPLLYFEVCAVYKKRKVFRDESTSSLYQLVVVAGLGLGQHAAVQLADVLHIHALYVAWQRRHARLQHRLQRHLHIRQMSATHTQTLSQLPTEKSQHTDFNEDTNNKSVSVACSNVRLWKLDTQKEWRNMSWCFWDKRAEKDSTSSWTAKKTNEWVLKQSWSK